MIFFYRESISCYLRRITIAILGFNALAIYSSIFYQLLVKKSFCHFSNKWFNIVPFHLSPKVPNHGRIFHHHMVSPQHQTTKLVLQHQNLVNPSWHFYQCTVQQLNRWNCNTPDNHVIFNMETSLAWVMFRCKGQ